MEPSLKKLTEKYCRHLEILFDLPFIPVECTEEEMLPKLPMIPEICRTCESCMDSRCCAAQEFVHGCREAYRWDGIYISFCRIGLVLLSVFVSDEKGELAGGIVGGPLCMGSLDDHLAEIRAAKLRGEAAQLPCFSPEKIQSMAEVLSALCAWMSGKAYGKSGRYFYSQESLLNRIYAEKIKNYSENDYYTYPITQERKLRTAIRNRDREEAENVLNQILAYIYVANNSNLEAIRPRIMELLVVLSRSAMDAGADSRKTDVIIQTAMKQLEEFRTIEELSAWVSNIMHRFLDTAFTYDRLKHADTIHQIDHYIQTHYQNRLTLDELAAQNHMSKTYLCSVFKKETGETIVNYINRVRIEKSKLLFPDRNLSIVQIAHLCGFEDQSYFTKIFKSYVGVTPKKYREGKKREHPET